jgi:hypothetical protein
MELYISSDGGWQQGLYITYLPHEASPSWEPKRFAASQEIHRILWKSKVHYRIHKCPPPVPILSQLNQVPISIPEDLS